MSSRASYPHQDESDEDAHLHTTKRRKVIAEEEEDDPSPPPPSTTAAPPSPSLDAASASKARRPSAGSRSAAEKDKKKVHAEDAKNTPSILSFFSQPNAHRDSRATAQPAATKGEKAAEVSAFFAPRTAKKKEAAAAAPRSPQQLERKEAPHEEAEGKVKQSRDEQGEGKQSKRLDAGGGERKSDSEDAMDTSPAEETKESASTSPPPLPSSAPTAATEAERVVGKRSPKPMAVVQSTGTKAKPADPKKTTASKGEEQRKKGGPTSAMKRKRLERGEGDEGGDDEDDSGGLQAVADKEEAAVEDEDAESSSGGEEEEDQSSLARELTDLSKAAGEEKISSEDATPTTHLGLPSFHPIQHATWQRGQPVPYSALSAMFAAVEAESSRLRIIAILSDFLRSVIALTPADLLPAVYLCINSIAPAYEGKETGVGEFILKKVIANTSGLSLQRLRETAKDATDLGVLALNLRKKQVTLFTQAPLTVRGVFGAMKEMGNMSGKNVATKKEGMITKLMVQSKGEEAKFLIRSLQGKLRIGLQGKSLIAALARALVLTPPALNPAAEVVVDSRKSMSEKKFEAALEQGLATLKQAYIEVPNLDLLVNNILQYGLAELPAHCTLTPGVPVEVMLGKPASSITSILDKFSGVLFTLEYKYDGERAQVHRTKEGVVKVYSRNSEDHTRKYPDLVGRLKRYEVEGVTDYVIDCECVAWDKAEKRLLPFQTLTTRKRKDVKEEEITVQVALFAFDLLYLNGRSYLKETLRARRDALRSHFREVEGEFSFATHRNTSDVEEIATFLNDAVHSSCEGLMVKALDEGSHYTPGKRSWLKAKKDYLEGVGDTLDLVPIAAFYGKGKRTGAYGAFLLACYDEDAEEYQSICKIGTGFSEEDIAQHAAFFNQPAEDGSSRLLAACPRYYKLGETMKPDVWFAPVQVWEVKCADLSISPVHQAAVGRVDKGKGVALRFPRFMRVRDDKKPEEATTAEQVVDLFKNQNVRAGQRKGKEDDED